jgi:hypothetical protein
MEDIMPAKTTIAISDSSTTPEAPGTPGAVVRTFVPAEMENGVVHTFYENTTGSTLNTRSKLTLSLTPGDGVTRFKAQLSTPKAQTVDGVVVQAHVTRGSLEFILPADGSRDDRVDIRLLFHNLLANSDVATMIKDVENLW